MCIMKKALVMWTLLGVCQGSLFERVYFWQKILSQGYIFLPKSLAKGIFLTKPPKNWHFGAKLASVFRQILYKMEYLGWNSLKSCKNGLMTRKSSLAKGMFLTKISLAKGIRSKTGAAHPRRKFFGEVITSIVKCGNEIAFPFSNFSGFIPHFTVHVITYSGRDSLRICSGQGFLWHDTLMLEIILLLFFFHYIIGQGNGLLPMILGR